MGSPTETRVLVTGATGFLGGAVARRLAADGVPVVGHGRDEGSAEALERDGIETRLMDLTERGAGAELLEAVRPTALVHCAAKSAPFGPRRAFMSANVDATEELVEAALRLGLRRFVHISSPSIYCAGRPLVNASEDTPLPRRFINHYAASKAAGEAVVRDAAAKGLVTITLRPRAIFGPGDTALFPRLMKALDGGGLPIIGSGENQIDLTYVDNVVDAVALALVADPSFTGRAYNITGGEPARLWELIRELSLHVGHAPPKRRVPRRVARAAALGAELAHRALRRPGEPRLTRYSVDSLSLEATLDISAARKDLGYAPRVTVAEGFRRFLESLDAREVRP